MSVFIFGILILGLVESSYSHKEYRASGVKGKIDCFYEVIDIIY